MDAAGLEVFLDERRYCVLATSTAKGPPRRGRSRSRVFDDAFWFGTVAGGRLRNLERTPWVSVVIADGEGDEHRAVAADGPVTLHSDAARRASRSLGSAIRLSGRMGRRLVRAAPRTALLLRRPSPRRSLSSVPEGDTLHRAAARLQPLVGQQLEVESPHPRAQAERRRPAARRPAARFHRGDRQESRAAVRRRRCPSLPPPDDRALGAPATRRAAARPAMARPPRHRARRRSLGRARARAPHAVACSARARHPRLATRLRRDARPAPPRPTDAHARRDASSIRASSPGSGTSGWRRRSGRRSSRPGFASPTSPRPTAAAYSSSRPSGCERPSTPAASLAAGSMATPAVPCPRCRTLDPLSRAGRCQPHRVLVPDAASRRD